MGEPTLAGLAAAAGGPHSVDDPGFRHLDSPRPSALLSSALLAARFSLAPAGRLWSIDSLQHVAPGVGRHVVALINQMFYQRLGLAGLAGFKQGDGLEGKEVLVGVALRHVYAIEIFQRLVGPIRLQKPSRQLVA